MRREQRLYNLRSEPLQIAYLRRCADALTPSGFIFVKENVLPVRDSSQQAVSDAMSAKYERGFEVDVEDNGLTRTDERYRLLFEKAGLDLVCGIRQSNWPSDLYPIFMYVLRNKA